VAAASSVVRAGLETIVSAGPGLEVVGSAAGTAGLAEQIETTHPDVVLVELERGSETPAPALPVGSRSDPPALVLLADDPESLDVAEALRLGARAVLPRQAQPDEIVAAVGAAAAGLLVLHPESVDALLPVLSTPTVAPGQIESLTPREIEVLSLLAEGAGNKLIARRLGISEHTVKFHVGSILAKLNASSRTEAVTLGIRQGLIMV
jgi:DNA-binding NarL/FixJ family response regulator